LDSQPRQSQLAPSTTCAARHYQTGSPGTCTIVAGLDERVTPEVPSSNRVSSRADWQNATEAGLAKSY